MNTVLKHEFADDLAHQWDRVAALYPQLLNAVEPAKPPPFHGTVRLNVPEFWEEYSQHDWQPSEARTVAGPFRMYGDFLDPVAKAGELHWYDPLTPAKDGDIVLVQWDASVLEAMYARNASNADWMALYGDACPIATKVLKTLGSSQYLVTRKSAMPLGQNRILGVLKYRERADGAIERPVCAMIEQNAATEIYTSKAKISGAITTTNGTSDPSTLTSSTKRVSVLFTPHIDCSAVITWSAILYLGASGSGTPGLYYNCGAQDVTSSTTEKEYGSVSGVPGGDLNVQFSTVAVFDLIADHEYSFYGSWTKALGSSSHSIATNSEILRVEIVKR